MQAVDAATRPEVDPHLADLMPRYGLVRRFLPTLLATLRLEAAAAGDDVLAAWKALRALEGRRTVRSDEVPLALATGPWTGRILGPNGQLNRPAYTFLVLERLREALRRRDVYAPDSRRWADPRARLLDGQAWRDARAGVAVSLGHDLDPRRERALLTADLDAAYRAPAGSNTTTPCASTASIAARQAATGGSVPLDRSGSTRLMAWAALRSKPSAT